MALDDRQQALLQQLVGQGILKKPKLGSSRIAPIDNRKSDFASYLLANAMEDKGVAKAMGKSLAATQDAGEEEKGFVSKIFSTLMIPNHTAAGIGDALASGLDEDESFLKNMGDQLGGIGKSLLGGAVRASDATVMNAFEAIPFGIGDKVTEGLHAVEDKLLPERTFQNVLHDNFDVDNKALRYGGGLALDIALDPTTYMGGLGLVSKLGRGKKLAETGIDALDSKAAVSAVPEAFKKPPVQMPPKAAPVAEEALRGNAIPNQNFFGTVPELPRQDIKGLLPDENLGIPRTRKGQRADLSQARRQDIPDPVRDDSAKMVRRQQDFERAMTQMGKVADSPSKINMRSVNNVIQRIQEGALPAVMPKLPSATGDALRVSQDIADDFIDGLMGQKFNNKTLRWQGVDGRMTSRKLPPEMSPGQQIAMFNKIVGTAAPKTLDEARQMLRSAEDHLISLGVQPVRSEGIRVRLSDIIALTDGKVPLTTVIDNFTVKNFKKMDPVVRAAIQTSTAFRTMAMSDILENVTKYADKARRGVADAYTGRAKSTVQNQIIDTAVDHAAQMGASTKELKAALDLIKDVVKLDELPAENFLNHASDKLLKAVDEGKANPEIIAKFNDLVAQSLGITSKNISKKISGSNVYDTMMTTFTTWYGKGQFFKEAKGTFDAGVLMSQARAEALRKRAQAFTKDEIHNAWKVVVGAADNTVADPRTMEMSRFFRDYMDSVLKIPEYGMRLENATTKHLSVAERSQMFMKDVNRHLQQMNGVKAFQFSSKAIDRDFWNVKRNFSQSGEGWQASWARWNPDDPLKTLYDIDLALERTTREYAFLDNFATTFGSLEKTAQNNFRMPLSRIEGFHVPEVVAHQMMRVMNDVHAGNWAPHTPLGRFHGKALRIWKTGVTIYLPSHHIRNGIGDVYLMWMAGHNDPRAFIWGKRIMHSQKGRYKQAINSGDFQSLEQFTDPNAAKWAATEGKDIILRHKDVKVTAEELYVGALHRGLLKNANQLEDIFGESRIGFRPLKGLAHDAATTAAEYREHFIRLSHFTAAVNKGVKRGRKDLQKLFDDAAAEVNKWHPDGSDLTRFEQKYARNLVPFYSWLRKSTPLLAESLVTRPAKNLAYPRGMSALQNMLGIDSTVADPFPDDQLFPEWIRGYGIGPIGDVESDNPFAKWWGGLGKNMINIAGDPFGYTVINPSNPLIDSAQQYLGFGPKDTGRGIVDSLTPFIKVPFELGTDSQFTGAPIYRDSGGSGLLEYLGKQVPMTAPFSRALDTSDTYKNLFGIKPREGAEPGIDTESIINALTAAGVHGTAPYIKTAEFEKKDKLRGQRQ